jgi:hypothetical protein
MKVWQLFSKIARVIGQATYPSIKFDAETMNLENGSPFISSVEDATSVVNLQNSFIGNQESMNAYHAKEDTGKYHPHVGLETINTISSCISNLSKISDINLPDYIVSEIESLIALFFVLRETTSVAQFSSAVFLYVKTHSTNKSVCLTVTKYLQEVFNEDSFNQQSEESTPSWLNTLHNVQENWNLCKGNRAFKQLSKLLGVLVILGLCDASKLTFNIAGFKLFDAQLLEKHMTALDVADALLCTVTFFAEGMYKCFQQGSIRPLLVNDHAALELDEEFTLLVSYWTLVKNGNLERVMNVTDHEFGRRIDSLKLKLSNLTTTVCGLDRKLVNDKLAKIMSIKNDLITLKISSGIRKAPFAFEAFGKSSQGKTTFCEQMIDALLTSAGLPCGKEQRCTMNASDKFMSNWTSDKTVAIIDDFANGKSSFVEKPPTEAIIQMCNNAMAYAPKAELESKGKCFIEPELLCVTTNKKDLDAYTYSNCPFSVQRRMNLVITVKCKDQFQRKDAKGKSRGVDSTKVREHYTDDKGNYKPPLIDDIWEITIEQAVEPSNLLSVAAYEVIEWRGKPMRNVSALIAINCAIDHFHLHRKDQQSIIDANSVRSEKLKLCSTPGCRFLCGMCPLGHKEPPCVAVKETPIVKPKGPQFGLQTAIALECVRQKVVNRVTYESESLLGRCEGVITKTLYKQCDSFLTSWNWLCILPADIIEHKYFQVFAIWCYSDVLKRKHNQTLWSMWTLILILCYFYPLASLLFILFGIYQHVYAMSKIKANMINELKKRNGTLPLIIKRTRDNYAKEICATVAGLGALYACAKIYRQWKSLQPIQGSLEPKTEAEIKQRDTQLNVWAEVKKQLLPVNHTVATTTWNQLDTLMEKNLVYGSVNKGDKTLMCNLLFIKSNLVLIPNHYFGHENDEYVDTLSVTCYKQNATSIGGSFTTRLDKSSSYLVPNTDLRLCYSSTGGSFKDITKYFPSAAPGDQPFQMSWRRKDGSVIKSVGRTHERVTTNTVATFLGGDYFNLSMNTFPGLCGATLVSQTKNPLILGVHVGGHAGRPEGCFCLLTSEQIEEALPQIRKAEGVLLTGEMGNFTPQILGVEVLTDKPLHYKSALNYLPEGSQLQYFGSCIGQTTARTDVKKTLISDIVTEVTGSENVYGPPKLSPEWYGYQLCLANASLPGKPFPHDLLSQSVKDYKEPLLSLIKTDMWNGATPLTDHENVCGKIGVKFIDAINLSTSIGFPLTGPKNEYIIELEPTADKPNNREFAPLIMTEIKRCEDLYANGQRVMSIAKACKKDEVVVTSKNKCRIFYGNPIALTFLVRKYFLPILRFLQMNPLKSECAVGINCHGPEWEDLYQFVMTHGEKRIFGGDYGKYDQKLPSQLLLASIRILIDLARECNYTQRDLDIMEAMAGDIVYALIAFNGDLIGLSSGTHISGNSLTVILNGISGSLNLRNFFYTKYPYTVSFRDAASMVTYGDDNIGSVSPDYPDFNIKACAEFLATYGQIYTMPDKESALSPYLAEGEFEFLKRESIHHPRLGRHLGALDLKSIYKSLHCYMRPKKHPLTPEQACALNIDTAMRELFNHGKDTYESQRVLMTQIANKAEIEHMCTMLRLSYEDRVADWYTKYNDSE